MKTLVKNRQIFFLCLVPVLGFGIFSVANTSVRYLSTGAWAAILAAAVLILPAALMLCALAKRYPGETLMEYAPKAAGKVAGNLLAGVYALFFLVFAGLLISYFSHVVVTWILPHTDYRWVAGFLVLICAYAISKDFTSLIRLVSFVGALCVLAVLAMRVLMIVFGNMDNLLPLIEPDVLRAGLPDATGRIFGFFFCIGSLAILPQGKHNRGSMLIVILGVLGAAFLLALVCAACISVLGVPQTALYKDAMALAMKTFDISRSTFIQRADVIFIITWSLLILSTLCCTCYIPFSFVKRFTNGTARRLSGAALCILLFVIALLPADFSTALSAANASCLTFGLAALYVIPLILLIVSGVRRHEKR